MPERILIREILFLSKTSYESKVPVRESNKEELDRRLERHINSPDELLSLEQLQTRIDKRK